MSKFIPFSLFLLTISIFSSCIPDPVSEDEIFKQDVKEIETYLDDKNLTAQVTATGLHYIIEDAGTGGSPSISDKVTVRYKGYLLDGTVFDETVGTATASFNLSGLIQGWQEGIPLLQKGGKGKFLIPSKLAYGRSGSGNIPANTPIAFDIELVNF